MTKDEFIDEVVRRSLLPNGKRLTKAEAAVAIGAVFDTVLENVATKGEAGWPSFGTFKLTQRAARVGRNPKTNEPINIPAAKNVSFKLKPTAKAKL